MDHGITVHTFGKPIMGIDAPIIDIEDVDSFVSHKVSLVAVTLEMEKKKTYKCTEPVYLYHRYHIYRWLSAKLQ